MKRWVGLGLCAGLLLSLSLGCASSNKKAKEAQAERRKRTVILTSRDDVRVGKEGAREVASQIGTLDDPALEAYVSSIGQKLVKALPVRSFAYHFAIVDQMEPNAFALPGGYIFVSRGLLALANNEDELACVLGHEIIHAARRHAAKQQVVESYHRRLSLPSSRARTMAAYSRDMEREADELGQRLAAAAGYDPMGMATFMRRLDQRERILIGAPRNPTFYDSHPGTRERATANAVRSRELRWTRDPSFGDPRKRLLDHTDGMIIGDRPETGVFDGQLFLHPVLDFEIKFPRGWQVQNSQSAVGARSPRQDAVVFLTSDMPEGDLEELAEDFLLELQDETPVTVTERKRVRLGAIPALRYAISGGRGGRRFNGYITFFPYAKSTWRLVGIQPLAAGNHYLPQILLTARTFRPLTAAHRRLIHADHMRVALTRSGEDLVRLGARTGNEWDPTMTGLINGLLGDEVFEGGELMKILRREAAAALPTD